VIGVEEGSSVRVEGGMHGGASTEAEGCTVGVTVACSSPLEVGCRVANLQQASTISCKTNTFIKPVAPLWYGNMARPWRVKAALARRMEACPRTGH
jgi:hypothetical protein